MFTGMGIPGGYTGMGTDGGAAAPTASTSAAVEARDAPGMFFLFVFIIILH